MVPIWGKCPTHFRTDFSGDWDVPWGYDLDFSHGDWTLQLETMPGRPVVPRLALGSLGAAARQKKRKKRGGASPYLAPSRFAVKWKPTVFLGGCFGVKWKPKGHREF